MLIGCLDFIGGGCSVHQTDKQKVSNNADVIQIYFLLVELYKDFILSIKVSCCVLVSRAFFKA